MVFYDDEQATLEKWLRDWMSEIFNIKYDPKSGKFAGEYGVGLLGEVCRTIYYSKRDSYGRVVEARDLFVFPSGEPVSINNSESGIRSVDVIMEVANSRQILVKKGSLY